MNKILRILSFILIIAGTAYAQDEIVLHKKNAAVLKNIKIASVDFDSLTFWAYDKKIKFKKRIALKEVDYYVMFDKKINKKVIHKVPLPPTIAKPLIQIPDPNAEYVRDHIKSAISYKKEEFTPGYVITLTEDTLKCLIKKNEDRRMHDFLYVVALHRDTLITVYEPKNILWYYKDSCSFKSFRSMKDSVETYFFIKLVEKGDVELYERDPVPSDLKQVYFIRNKSSDKFQYLPLPAKKEWDATDPENTVYETSLSKTTLSKGSDSSENLRLKLSNVVKDCPPIHSKVLNETYKIQDMRLIVSEYNKCGK